MSLPKGANTQLSELRSTMGKMEMALGTISEAIVWTDTLGRIQWCNRGFDALVGMAHIWVLGKSIVDLLPLEEHGTWLPPDAHPANLVLHGKKDTRGYFECRCRGDKVYIEFVGRYLEMPDSKESAIIVIHDLSGKKDLEQTKLQSAALHHAANAIVITDKNGAVMWVNHSFRNLTGYELEEVFGRNLSVLKSGKQDEAFYHHLWQTILSGEVWEGETINRKKDGSLYVEQQTIAPVLDVDGNIGNFIAIKQDISHRKRVEEELAQYRDRLEQMVGEKTRELEQAQMELVNRAMEAGMTQMAAIGLHNIGNAVTPLNVLVEKMKAGELADIGDYLQKCHDDLKSHLSDLGQYVAAGGRGRQVFDYMGELILSLRDYHKKQFDMYGKVEGALSYISQILTFQQSYAGGGQSIREQVDLNALLNDAIQLQTGALEKRGITVKRRYAEHMPQLLVDKNKLMQVILNIVKNSYEAIELNKNPSGERIIEIVTFLEDGSLGFEVIDNGIGVDPVDISTLFKLGESRKGSSGFGLYYCRMFLRNNNGDILLTSQGIGKGASVRATFTIQASVKENENAAGFSHEAP